MRIGGTTEGPERAPRDLYGTQGDLGRTQKVLRGPERDI